MKFLITFCVLLALCSTFADAFLRRCVITDYDCTLTAKICARTKRNQCRTFKNPCSMQMENCHRWFAYTQVAMTACDGFTDDVVGTCKA